MKAPKQEGWYRFQCEQMHIKEDSHLVSPYTNTLFSAVYYMQTQQYTTQADINEECKYPLQGQCGSQNWHNNERVMGESPMGHREREENNNKATV